MLIFQVYVISIVRRLQCFIIILRIDVPVTAAGTQVKWNRLDGNILASSHMDEVLIWDRRVSR